MQNQEATYTCPLCGYQMTLFEGKFTCRGNYHHVILKEKEFDRFNSGEKDRAWLQQRMKIRLGKLVHGR